MSSRPNSNSDSNLDPEPRIGAFFDMDKTIIAENSGNQTHDRIDQNHRGNLTAVQYEITDRHFIRLEDVDHALIESLVTTAQQ